MKIQDLTEDSDGDLCRVSATVYWEDCDRPRQELHFATHSAHTPDLVCNPNAFLLASIIPAMQYGEHRVQVEGAICPQLRNGLETAMQVLNKWYGEPAPYATTVEATDGFRPALTPEPRGTASFMSGGIDSLATLRCNRRDFPLGHPRSIRDCLFVHGFDVGGYAALDKNIGHFDLAVSRLSELTAEAGAALVPVYTNLRHLEAADPLAYDPQLTALGVHGQLFTMASHGAALASVGHAFSGRISTALIASTASIADLHPMGSHPLLDPNYSSSEVWIQHDGARLHRGQKLQLVTHWEAALQTLRTCSQTLRPSNSLNCGQCEKCLRTMTELLVLDKLRLCPTFPLDDISPDDLGVLSVFSRSGAQPTMAFLYDANLYHWKNLIEPLESIGRLDLTKVIRTKLAEYQAHKKRRKRKEAIKRFDRRFLGSTLATLNRHR